jgi:hypothetical protein
VGFNGNKPKEVMGVEDKATHGLYGDEDSNIDFEMGGMQLRASSVEEKKAWLAVLSNASMVRSYSSKNLEDLMGPQDVELGELRLTDLHMGEVLGSGTTGTVKLAVHIPTVGEHQRTVASIKQVPPNFIANHDLCDNELKFQ